MAVPVIYWYGLVHEHYDVVSGNTADNTASFDSDFMENSIRLTQTANVEGAVPARSECTFHMYVSSEAGTENIFLHANGGADPVVEFQKIGPSCTFYYYPNGVRTQIGNSWVRQNVTTYDFYVDMDAVSGTVRCMENQVIRAEISGVRTTPALGTQIDYVQLNSSGSSVSSSYYSEVSFWEGEADNPRPYLFRPDAAGTYGDWTGTFAEVNDNPLDETTFISTTLGGDQSTFGTSADLTNLNAAYSEFLIGNVLVCAYARREISGPTGFQWLLRSGVTDNNSATETLTAGYDNYYNSYTTDPNTASAWTRAGVDSLEVGVESVT